MAGQEEALPKNIRGIVIGLLVLSILNWPWPVWNAAYGFINTVYAKYSGNLVTLADLSIPFAIVTILHGCFALVKIVIFSLDLDRKLKPKQRLDFINWYLIIETAAFFLTIIFGLAATLYGYYQTGVEFYFWDMCWINMGITAFLQIVSLPLALKLRSWAKNHSEYLPQHDK